MQRILSTTGQAVQTGSGITVFGPPPATIAAGASLLSSGLLESIDAGNKVTGAVYYSGTVNVTPLPNNTGNGVIDNVSLGQNAPVGGYGVAFTSPTAYTVAAPSGASASGTVGTAFSGFGGLGFTISAGGTPFVAGDGFVLSTAPPAAATVQHGGGDGTDITVILP
jgi:hypothetical protein